MPTDTTVLCRPGPEDTPITGRVAGKVVLITGAARGQGAAEARALAAEGATVVATDIVAADEIAPGELDGHGDRAIRAQVRRISPVVSAGVARIVLTARVRPVGRCALQIVRGHGGQSLATPLGDTRWSPEP